MHDVRGLTCALQLQHNKETGDNVGPLIIANKE